MKNEEKLYLGIGEIDEQLVKEAAEAYTPRIPTVYKGLAIAASVAIISVVTVLGGVLFSAPKGSDKGNAPESSPGKEYDGIFDSTTTRGSLITNIELIDELKISFNLTVTGSNSAPIVLTLTGEYTGENEMVEHAVCTTAEDTENYKLALTPYYTVNGVRADALPTEIGEYEVTVDFSITKEYDVLWEDFISIDGTESFKIK